MSTVQPQYPQHVKGVEYFSLTAALKHFRQEVEKGTGAPIQTLEMNAALLLDDIASLSACPKIGGARCWARARRRLCPAWKMSRSSRTIPNTKPPTSATVTDRQWQR